MHRIQEDDEWQTSELIPIPTRISSFKRHEWYPWYQEGEKFEIRTLELESIHRTRGIFLDICLSTGWLIGQLKFVLIMYRKSVSVSSRGREPSSENHLLRRVYLNCILKSFLSCPSRTCTKWTDLPKISIFSVHYIDYRGVLVKEIIWFVWYGFP